MKPREHKAVQARSLAYAQEICWTFVPREEAEQKREEGIVYKLDAFVKNPNCHPERSEGSLRKTKCIIIADA
jgi:hypothetical protein